jgi:formylglycine-generating enzyme required for sulfatase activity
LSRQAAQRRKRRVQAVVGLLAFGVVAGLAAWVEHDDLQADWRFVTVTRPFRNAQIRPLTSEQERALKPGGSFRECAAEQDKDYCPEMIVVPAGSFMMGSPPSEKGHQQSEEPLHPVTIVQPFAVAKVELTFDEWDTCVAYGDCPQGVSDAVWGHGQRPVINVTWDDAQHYVAWLSRMTGKPYRLLNEAEYEYAARAGTRTAYPWGDDIKLNGKAMANCDGCGSQWDGRQTAPVGSFGANQFGLYDMVGNVFEWTEDCMHGGYNGAPSYGTAWFEGGDCTSRVVRGGSWSLSPDVLRSAFRVGVPSDSRNFILGIRVARTLLAP